MNDPRPRVSPEFAIEPHERSLARRVFLARVENGATVEAAKHQAVHAVKVWRQLDLFDGPLGVGEEEPLPGEPSSWMRFAREADAALAADHGLDRPKIAELYACYRDEFDFMASLVALAPERPNRGSDVPPAKDNFGPGGGPWEYFAREVDGVLSRFDAGDKASRMVAFDIGPRYPDVVEFLVAVIDHVREGSDVPPADDSLEKTTLNGEPVKLDSGVPLGNGSKLVTAMTRESDALDDFLGVPRQN